MLTGFNTDFKYKGTVYHVQTEDNGKANPVIVTLLYKGGAIVASLKISYSDIIKFEHLDRVVRELMEQQHKQIIKDLVSGKFSNGPNSGTMAKTDDSGTGAKMEKGLDELILDYLSSEEGDNK